MPTLPLNVQPGEIISSELMTLILARLSELSDVVLTGTQLVPDVIGMNLLTAKGVIEQPIRQLSLGFVVDTTGASINPSLNNNANLIVLNQSPAAGNLVGINGPVSLVVSSAADSGSNTGPQPTIIGTETLAGAETINFPVGETVAIVGTNFSANVAQNIVTFNGTTAIVGSDPADPTRRLFVTVPDGIPGAPVNPGDTPLNNVSVVVRNLVSNLTATTEINVLAPIANTPTIGTVTPVTQFEGEIITITGTNFTAETQVLIRDVQAQIDSVALTSITARVPQFADIQEGALVTASVVVNTPGVGSASFNGIFRIRGIPEGN